MSKDNVVYAIRISKDLKEVLKKIETSEIVFALEELVNNKLLTKKICPSCKLLLDNRCYLNTSKVCSNCSQLVNGNKNSKQNLLNSNHEQMDFSNISFKEFYHLVEEHKKKRNLALIEGDCNLITVNEFIQLKYPVTTYKRKLKRFLDTDNK